MLPILKLGCAAVVALGTGAATMSAIRDDVPDYAVPEGPWQRGTTLDGMVFHTVDTIRETGEVVRDELHFVDGRFQSAMCEDYCEFGWTGYSTWTEGDVVHFTTTTECPDAPHTVVWYGTVTGDEIRFEGTWTTRRWYWTRQLNVSGAGSTTPPLPGADTG